MTPPRHPNITFGNVVSFIALVLSISGVIYSAGVQAEKIRVLEVAAANTMNVPVCIARIEEQLKSIDTRTARIEKMVEK